MLVLTRRLGEGIRIGDSVRVIVVEIRDNQVRLGIEAPPGLSIHRDEIYLKIQEENIRATRIGGEDLEKLFDIWKDREG